MIQNFGIEREKMFVESNVDLTHNLPSRGNLEKKETGEILTNNERDRYSKK